MIKGFSRVALLAAVCACIVSCDKSTRAPENGSALTPGAGAQAAPAPTAGATATTGTETPAAASPAAAGPSAPAAAPATAGASISPAPRFREVTIPAGTVLSVKLNTAIGSDTSRAEQRVDGTLTRGVRVSGLEAVGAGASLRGIVTNAERSARVKGRASVAFRFNQLTENGQTYNINTRTIAREAPGTKKRDAATIGIPAAGGAIIGGILGGGDAAVKGSVIGGAAGTAAVLSTRGKEVRLAPGTTVSVRLASPLTVRVPLR